MPPSPLPSPSPQKNTLRLSHWRSIFLPRDCLAPDGLCQMAKLHSQSIFLIWGAHNSDCHKQFRRHWELTLGSRPCCKHPKQVQWTSEKLPCTTSKMTAGPADGHRVKEAGLSTSPCLQVLATIIWRSRSTTPSLQLAKRGQQVITAMSIV